MTSQQIRQYLTFNMGKSYTFVNVLLLRVGENRNSLNACSYCVLNLFMDICLFLITYLYCVYRVHLCWTKIKENKHPIV